MTSLDATVRMKETVGKKKYQKNTSNRKGTDYELILAILFLKRAVESRKEFLLATERSQDGKFDDLFFELGEGERVCLLQAKHKSSNSGVAGKIGLEDLTSQSDTNFSLLKYFNSYLGLKTETSLKRYWKSVNLILCTTISPDPNLNGIQFSAVQEEDGIFWKGNRKLGCVYRVCADSDVIENTFAGASSNLKKLAKKLSECVLEDKSMNIEQLNVVKQYHLALTKEVIQINKDTMLAPNFLLYPEKLSEEARKFRDLFFQCAVEYLNKKHLIKDDMTEVACCHTFEAEETDVLVKEMSVSSGQRTKKLVDYFGDIFKQMCRDCFEKIFWSKLIGQKLITPGQFGQVDKKTLKEIIKQIKESKSGDKVYEIKVPEKDIYKLFGYVLIVEGEVVKFNPEFLKTDMLTGNNTAIRDDLKRSASNIFECYLNIKGINVANVFRERVYWNLEDDFTSEEAEERVKGEVREFLNKLTFAVTSPVADLIEYITKELIGEFGERDGRSIFSTLLSDMTKWLGFRDKDGHGRYLSQTDNPYVMAKNKYQRYNRFYVQEPVRSFTGRKHQLREIHEKLRGKEGERNIGMVLYICGMGGVGKTQLAKKYAGESKQHYDGNVFWIECEDPFSISNSFSKYAKEMHIDLTNDDGTERELNFIAEDVYGHFSENISLFIFDNVGEFKDIESILPGDGLTSNKPFILITTRNRGLFKDQGPQNLEQVALDVFPEEEAMGFIMKELRDQNPCEKEVKELMNVLGRLPLALQHAIAYIKSSFSNEFSISDYVKLLEESPGEFNSLLEQDPCIGCDSYKMTIYKTFTMAAEKIRKSNENDNLSLEILNFMAYLSPENVPKKIFIPLALKRIFNSQHKEKRANGMISRAVYILKHKSIVDEEQDLLQIHRVVQNVIRLKLSEENDAERDTLRDILKLMSEDGALKNDLSHVRSVWYYASKYVPLIDSFYFRTDTECSAYGKYCSTPLHLLSESGKSFEIDSILKHLGKKRRGSFVSVLDARDLLERTPLYIAAENDRLSVIQTLIEYGAKVETRCKVSYRSNTTRRGSGWTPLCVAAYKGHQDVVEYLVSEKKESRDVRDSLGRTPSIIAAHLGHVHLIRLPNFVGRNEDYHELMLHAMLCSTKKNTSLYDLREFLDGIDKDKLKDLLNSKLAEWTPLHHVIRRSFVDHMQLLLDRGAELSRSGFTHLHMAATIGNLDTIKMLVKEGADPKDVNEDGWTSLHAAAQQGHTEVLEYFLDDLKGKKRIDVNIRDGKDDIPLHTAAFHGKLGVMKSLLERGAMVNSINRWGCTPLFSAILGCNRMVLKRVLAIGDLVLDVTEIDRSRDTLLGMLHLTVLHIAAALDDLETVKFLVERRGMDVDVGKGDGCTPLHIAALFNCSNVIEYLLSRRADIDAMTTVANFSKIIEFLEVSGLIKYSPGYMSKLAFQSLKILKIFGRYTDVVLSYVTKMTPKSISKFCGYENSLLRMGSEEQGILASTIFSIIFVRGQVGVLKSLLEKQKDRQVDEMNEEEFYFLERFSVGRNK